MSRGHGASRRRNYAPRQHDMRRRRVPGRLADAEWPRTWASDPEGRTAAEERPLTWDPFPADADRPDQPPATGASR
jgi:hypothetical protein